MKVCLIGSAPSSVALAPYNDPEWKIFGCSPGAYVHCKRVDAWFEIHRWEPPWGQTPRNWFTYEYIKWMSDLSCPVYMIDPVPEIKNSVAFPLQQALDEFGPFFFASSISWMFAIAIMAGAKEIMLAGVDMAAQEEWFWQRQSCQHFIWICKKHYGIKVTVPPESDIMRPPPLYGFCEVDPMHIKTLKRGEEIDMRIANAERNIQACRDELMFLKGAKDDLLYYQKTWIADRKAVDMAYQWPLTTPALNTPAPEATPAAPIAETAVKPKRSRKKANGAHVEVASNG